MGHTIEFEGFGQLRGLLTEEEARDLVDVLFRFKDSHFRIIGDAAHRRWRGFHTYSGLSRVHTITLFRRNIEQAFALGQRVGGNGRAPSVRMAAAMVLAHELQHANQVHVHRNSEVFYTTRQYNKRPCEREARAFVDDNLATVAAVIGQECSVVRRSRSMVPQVDPVPEVAELLGECEEVTVADVGDELRRLGANNPANVQKVCLRLSERGVRVVRPGM